VMANMYLKDNIWFSEGGISILKCRWHIRNR